jgi:hypothetical protein
MLYQMSNYYNAKNFLINDKSRCIYGETERCINKHNNSSIYCEEHFKARIDKKICSAFKQNKDICNDKCIKNSNYCSNHVNFDIKEKLILANKNLCGNLIHGRCEKEKENKKIIKIHQSLDVIKIVIGGESGKIYKNTDMDYYQDNREEYIKELLIIIKETCLKFNFKIDDNIEIIENVINKKTGKKMVIVNVKLLDSKKKCTVEIYQELKCRHCREKMRNEEEKQTKKIKNDVNFDTETHQICTKCYIKKEKNHYISKRISIYGKETIEKCKKCDVCRVRQRIQDRKRQHRKNYFISEKAILKKKNKSKNCEDILKYCKRSREKMREEMGDESYKAMNNEIAKIYRATHKDYIDDMKYYSKISRIEKYYYYKYSAVKRNINFTLSFILTEMLFNGECYYCGNFSYMTPNGIDRINNNKGYDILNCVSCCETCNMIKKCLSPRVLFGRINHILSYNKIIEKGENNIKYRLFADSSSEKIFSDYIKSAKKRKKEFEITHDDFQNIIKGNCYICGKVNTPCHKNGIDRFDSMIGYKIDNCRACCSECNYMKNDIPYENFINHLIDINNNNKIENYIKTVDDYTEEIMVIEHDISNLEGKINNNDKIKNELINLKEEYSILKQKKYMLSMTDEEYVNYVYNYTPKLLFLRKKYEDRFSDEKYSANDLFDEFIENKEYLNDEKLISNRPTYLKYYCSGIESKKDIKLYRSHLQLIQNFFISIAPFINVSFGQKNEK